MTRVWFLLLGATAAMIFALTILVIVPKAMLTAIEPPPDLKPYTVAQAAGRQVYISEGCIYCHSQQIRDPAFTTDQARGWGRASVPSDYYYDVPQLMGTARTGPDLFNVAARLPDRHWQLLHLYQPRALVPWSIMPSFGYLFRVKDAAAPGEEVVTVPPAYAPAGKVIVASPEASHLVDYLLSLDHTYPPVQPTFSRRVQSP
ncbi:MAG TPA: cbb3-type cytochrome c oxidase subunit II [Stenomitos sp.]